MRTRLSALALFFFCFYGVAFAQPLSGTYTIGGVSPNYNTFSDAVSSLITNGISGPVIFNVRTGTYNEQISIPLIGGVSNTNRISFTSETGNKFDVILTYSPDVFNFSYVVRLDNADYITFGNMTIRSNDQYFDAPVFELRNNTDHLIIQGCLVEATPTTISTDIIYSFSSSGSGDSLLIKDNIIRYGRRSVSLTRSTGNPSSGLVIEGNLFDEFRTAGVYLEWCDDVQISRNHFTNSASSSNGSKGMHLYECGLALLVERNYVIMNSDWAYGIFLNYCEGVTGSPALIANNCVIVETVNYESHGIYMDECSYVDVFFNSVHSISQIYMGGSALYIEDGENNRLGNNNLVSNQGYPIKIYSNNGYPFSTLISSSDRNNLFSASGLPVFMSPNGSYANLLDWTNAFGTDANSISVDPLFLSSTDLHVREPSLKNAGLPHPGISIDFDGDVRNPLNPDIGADEFILPVVDAGISSIFPTVPFAAGANDVIAVLRNFGSATLTSVSIGWKLDGATQTPVNWNGSLTSGSSTMVTLGSKNFPAFASSDIQVWSYAPNGATDLLSYNDTVTINDLYPALSGTYTIGGTNPDFVNFSNTVTAMNNGGVLGNVTFLVRSGVYNEQLQFTKITGADTTDAIIYKSESGDSSTVTLTQSFNSSSNNYTLLFNGADGISFKDMTLAATGTTFNQVVLIRGGSDYLTFSGNLIRSTPTSNSYLIRGENYTAGNNHIVIERNILRHGAGIYMTSNLDAIRGTVINGNTIIPYGQQGIHLVKHAAPVIRSNTITADPNSPNSINGMIVNSTKVGVTIESNRVSVKGGTGLGFEGFNTEVNATGLIANNFFHSDNGSYAVQVQTFDGDVKFYNNNLHLSGTVNTAANTFSVSGFKLKIRNNNLVNTRGGKAIDINPNYFTQGVSDFNNFYTTGANIGRWYVDQPNLAAWRTASGLDSNSLSVDPFYTSVSDLHVSRIDLNGAATPVPEVTTDIDGDARHPLTPDIGADEFTGISDDAGIMSVVSPAKPFAVGSNIVVVQLHNYGNNILTSATINWSVNGILQTPSIWNGSLTSGASVDSLFVGTFTFNPLINYIIQAWTTNPNGNADNNVLNDSATANVLAGLSGTYTIGGSSPDFVTFSQAVAALNNAGVVGAVTFLVRDGTYTEQITIGQIDGNNVVNTIRFQSESGDSSAAILTYASTTSQNNFTLKLNGVDYITIHGITIRSTNTNFAIALAITNQSEYTTISNNRLVGVSTTQIGAQHFVASSMNAYSEFRNNFITGGSYGIYYYPATVTLGAMMIGNRVENFAARGISVTNANAPLISENYITSNKNAIGIGVNSCTNNARTVKNQVYMNNGGEGIQYIGNNPGILRGLIANNFIYVGTNPSRGISITSNSNRVDVYYNNILLAGNAIGSDVLNISGSNNINLKNNILMNTAGGRAVAVFSSPTLISASDYNNIYTTAANYTYVNNVAQPNLAAWQAATGFDMNSISVNPVFISSGDLHITNTALDSAGTPIAGITDDIDGDTRNLNFPDIGADEITNTPTDVGITAVQVTSTTCGFLNQENIRVSVKNFGAQPQSGFDVILLKNGTLALSENIGAVVIPPNGTIQFNFTSTVDLSATGTYQLTAFTALQTDAIAVNDTFRVSISNPLEQMPAITIAQGIQTFCLGDTVHLTASSSSSAQWSTGATSLSISVTPADTTWYFLNAVSLLGCPFSDSVRINIIAPAAPGPVANMVPANGTTGLFLPILFNWSPASGASHYDIYIWDSTANPPSVPTVPNITQISYSFSGNLAYGIAYKWQVVSRTSCWAIPGPIQTFTVRELPDLTVSSLQVPSSAFSGQPMTINWQVTNIGDGSTDQPYWYDNVYLSADATLDIGIDYFLGSKSNLTALSSAQNYNQTATYNIPNGISGNYFVFVWTDFANLQMEESNSNNVRFSNPGVQVNLTPPADLQVTSLTTPTTLFSGQQFNFSYTVKNEGGGVTNNLNWHDIIRISSDSVLNVNQSTVIRSFSHIGSVLMPDSSYTNNFLLTLPPGIFGTYYIYVTTDYQNAVYEHAFENNNTTRSVPINIVLTPPPDLVVTNITIPASASNKEQIDIEWTVQNQGGSTPVEPYSSDFIYLTTDASGNLTNAVSLGAGAMSLGALAPGNTYTITRQVTIPASISGNYYIYVHADKENRVFEYQNDSNNVTRSTNPLLILSPDIVCHVDSVADANSGQPVMVSWSTDNAGPGKLFGAVVKDRVMISSSPVYHPDSVTQLGIYAHFENLLPGSSSQQQQSFTLPNGIAGTKYLFVHSDFDNTIFENGNDNNNISPAFPVQVTLSPWADLTGIAISRPDTAKALDTVFVSYTVKNVGTAVSVNNVNPLFPSANSAVDRLYLSASPQLDSTALQLSQVFVPQFVEMDSAYTYTLRIVIPASFDTGWYYFHLFTDATNKIYEHTGENNNILSASPVLIYGYPPIDLVSSNVIAPNTASSGTKITVQFTVGNQGQASTIAGTWRDAVYLSTDAVLNRSSDQLLAFQPKFTTLNAGNSYSQSIEVTIPNGVSGNYYLLAVTDYQNNNNDIDTLNNTFSKPIQILLTPPPDLQVISLISPQQAIAGQPLTLTWTVKNTGTGPTVPGTWAERFYISNDFVLDSLDLSINTYSHNGILAPNDTYTATDTFYLPLYKGGLPLAGNYILLQKTDVFNTVYEHLNENNNVASASIFVIQPDPSDLIVDSVRSRTDTFYVGRTAIIDWKTKNIGLNPASGLITENVYISEDSASNSNDVLFGILGSSINLPPSESRSIFRMNEVPGLKRGFYFPIVKTDVRNNVPETDETNNTGIAVSKVFLDVPELPIDVLVYDTLKPDRKLFYRIDVPVALRGGALLVTLRGDSLNGRNELYTRFGEMPTRTVYDFAHDNPFQGIQEVVIPNLRAGTYYLFAVGNFSQNVTLKAERLTFGIRTVNVNKGGNTGSVTVEIKGALFEPDMEVALLSTGRELLASAVYYVNSTKIFATFNLGAGDYIDFSDEGESWMTAGVDLGYYDVRLRKAAGAVALLVNGFEVVPGTPPLLETSIYHPGSVRPLNMFSMQVNYANGGNIDLVLPKRAVISQSGVPIARSVAELRLGFTDLYVEFGETGGPPGLLRPGVRGNVILYSRATINGTVLRYSTLKLE